MGTYELVGKKEKNKIQQKRLVKDYCTSEFNLKKSIWPHPDGELTDGTVFLNRLQSDFACFTTGLNINLTWRTGSDLDLQTMCGCKKWWGVGTPNGNKECTKCGMKRDMDMMGGEDGRRAFEHVYFKDPKLIYNKEIGVRVCNTRNNTKQRENKFKLSISNGFGYQLYPEP